MITLFENYINNIKTYIIDNKIPSVQFRLLGWSKQLDSPILKPLTYENVMRFCTYYFLINYRGNNPIINSYIKGLKNKNQESIEIINKFGRNRKILNHIKRDILPEFSCTDYTCSDISNLNLFIDNYNKIFIEKNFLEFLKKVSKVTEESKKSESIAKNFLSNLFYKSSTLENADDVDDRKGIDLWKIDRETGRKESIQVKNIEGGKTTLKIFNDNVIYINNSDIDLPIYDATQDSSLHFDYLALYVAYERKLYLIKSRAILKIENIINKETRSRSIKITIGRFALDKKYLFNVYDIGPKYTGKDTSRVFY